MRMRRLKVIVEMRAQKARSLYEPVVTSPTYDDFSCLLQADSEQYDLEHDLVCD